MNQTNINAEELSNNNNGKIKANLRLGIYFQLMIISCMFVPFFKVNVSHDSGGYFGTYYYSIFSSNIIGLAYVIIAIISLIIMIYNYCIIRKNKPKKQIGFGWIIALFILLLPSAVFIDFFEEILDWAMNEASYWPSFTTYFTKYIYDILLILDLIYIIVTKIKYYKKN